MKLEGAYDVPAPRKKVWDAFQDPKLLKKAIPGCEKLEAVGPDEYKATMKVGVGGVKGTFEGKVKLSDKQPPDSYKMLVEGAGGPGFIRGETVITLTDQDGGTKVSYSADLQVGGLIASVGQRMLGGVSKIAWASCWGPEPPGRWPPAISNPGWSAPRAPTCAGGRRGGCASR